MSGRKQGASLEALSGAYTKMWLMGAGRLVRDQNGCWKSPRDKAKVLNLGHKTIFVAVGKDFSLNEKVHLKNLIFVFMITFHVRHANRCTHRRVYAHVC